MPRQPRIDQQGLLYHVFARGIERREIFKDNRDRDRFLSIAGDVLIETDTPLHAFALLPNHFHFLLYRNGSPLSTVMRRLLTSYAMYFNKRHDRAGHLFQNRYRAIICQEDRYYLELVRYIHLNPVRSGSIATLAALDGYRYSGHSHLMGRISSSWYQPEIVLPQFGTSIIEARARYRDFLSAGLECEEVADFDGGGMKRSQRTAGKEDGKPLEYDDRILGDGQFVARLLDSGRLFPASGRKHATQSILADVCSEFGIPVAELLSGSRRRFVVEARRLTARRLSREEGLPVCAIAKELSISTTAVSRILKLPGGRVSS